MAQPHILVGWLIDFLSLYSGVLGLILGPNAYRILLGRHLVRPKSIWNNGTDRGGMCCECKMDVAFCGLRLCALVGIPLTGFEPLASTCVEFDITGL